MENLVKASVSTKYVVSLMAPKGYLFTGQGEYDYNNILDPDEFKTMKITLGNKVLRYETTMSPELSDSDFTELLISTGAIFKALS